MAPTSSSATSGRCWFAVNGVDSVRSRPKRLSQYQGTSSMKVAGRSTVAGSSSLLR